MDDMLQALLMQVDEVYSKTKSNKINNVEDMAENVVGTNEFYILAEPSINPNFYNYVTSDLNIRLSKYDVLNQTVIYSGDEAIFYRDLDSDRIKNSIIAGLAKLGDVILDDKLEKEAEEIGRGSR